MVLIRELGAHTALSIGCAESPGETPRGFGGGIQGSAIQEEQS